MFTNRDIPYVSSNDSFSCPDFALNPASRLFTPSSPWGLSSTLSDRGSESSMELDDMAFGTQSYPSPGVIQADFFSMAEGSNDAIPSFMDQHIPFQCNDGRALPDQSMMGYNTLPNYDETIYDSFDVQTRLQNPPMSLGLDMYAQMSNLGSPSLPMSFVVPSQTTFADAYDVNLPMRELKPVPIRNSGPSHAANSSMNTSNVSSKFRVMQSQTTRSCPARLRPSLTGKPAFEALQKGLSLSNGRTENYDMTQMRRQRTGRGSGALPTVPSHVRVQNKAIKKCDWPGCSKRFQRQEHLKRHEKTHGNAEMFICQFCQKPFGRSDNLKSHTYLHTQKTPRTQHFPEAQQVYEDMSRKPRKVRDLSTASAVDHGKFLKCKL